MAFHKSSHASRTVQESCSNVPVSDWAWGADIGDASADWSLSEVLESL